MFGVTADNELGLHRKTFTSLTSPWEAILIHQQTPQDAYAAVLAHAGCSLPSRDAVDRRIIEEVRNGTAPHGRNGIIDTPDDVGGWPELSSGTGPVDTDNNGMPDMWEEKYGLNVNDADDNSADADGDGYTNVEEWLNGTDPTKFVDYTKSEMNINTLEKSRGN